MSENKRENHPFHRLGTELKQTRERRRESLAEVSGAVEIDIDALSAYEIGARRPSEDVLLLLISHFAIKEDEATRLWDMAGYDQQDSEATNAMNDDIMPLVSVMPMDVRIVYTDMFHVMTNQYGVVMNFMQGAGPKNQPLAVARIGMSREHAQSMLEILQKTLSQSEPQPKALPSPKTQSKKQSKE